MATPQLGNSLPSPESGWTRKFCNKSNVGTFFKNIRVGNDNFNASWQYIGDDTKPTEESSWFYIIFPKSSDDDIFSFEFTGTSLRILQKYYSGHRRNIKVRIDNGIWMDGSVIRASTSRFRVCFEKLDLPRGTHKVEVIAYGFAAGSLDSDTGTMISAIDYADLGDKVGDVLKEPEPGWSRFDDRNSAIRYEGSWTSYTDQSNGYLNSQHIKNNEKDKLGHVFFNFTGTKLRILAYRADGAYFKNAKIVIDGVTYDIPQINTPSSAITVLVFEKTDLNPGTHTVHMYDYLLNLDAIDVGQGERILAQAKVGDVLTQPEPGWKRFDDTDSNIKYKGVWATERNSKYYNSTCHYKHSNSNTPSDSNPISIKFNFKGTKLRIISLRGNAYDSDAKILIDGKEEVINFKSTEFSFQCLVYENLNLSSEVHTVEIKGIYMTLDAIDIDADGSLFTPAKVGDVLKEPEPGWKRFDDTDPLISYAGPWTVSTNTPLDNYNKTLHVKDYRNSTAAEFKFTFKGTGIRLIATLSDVPNFNVESTITIDGASETFKGYHLPYAIQGLAFQKFNLKDGVHTVKVSTPAFIFDAVDIQNGELISEDVIKKPKVSLYEKESGKIFVDDFDSVNPKWLMSPSNAFNNAVKKGFLRMNHADNKDVMLLIDKPQSNFAIQVIADYTPTKEGDKGGLLIYKNEANNIEFLESMKVSDSPDPKEWMAVCKENQWDFYNKTDVTFDYVRSEQLDAHKIGVVLKKGNAEGFTPLDINKIIITTSNLLRLRQLYEKYKVVLKDAAENVISTSFVEAANTGIDIPLPSLEFEGIVEIYDEDGTLVAKRQTTFFGGDMYCMGSSLHISMDTKELDETDPTHLGYMTETERLVKMTLTNDNVGPVSNVKVAIQQYMEKFGYTWAHVSLDGSHYTDELAIETLDAGSSKDFWVKIIKDVNYMAFEPIYFNIHLSHE